MNKIIITQNEKDDILNYLKILMNKFNKHKYQALPNLYIKEKNNIKFEIDIIKREPELQKILI